MDMKRLPQLVLVHHLLLAWQRAFGADHLPALPSLMPPSTTLLGPAEEWGSLPQEPPPSTVFSQKNNTVLRAQVSTTAVLHCLAHNVGKNTVSWIRRRDYHLLTVGTQAYSSDDRFQVRYIKQENDWQLHIRYVQRRDHGLYECQVSSHPPVSLFSTLTVLEATSEILGGPEKYMTVGSFLRLVCVLKDNTQPPSYVFWYRDQQMINYHPTREIRVETNGGLSVLFLGNVRPSDSGNYTCSPSNTRPAHIQIHVLKGGETPAAIHSGSNNSSVSYSVPLVLTLLLCVASTYFSRISQTTGGRSGTPEALVPVSAAGECRRPSSHGRGTRKRTPPPHAPEPRLLPSSPTSASGSLHNAGFLSQPEHPLMWPLRTRESRVNGENSLPYRQS